MNPKEVKQMMRHGSENRNERDHEHECNQDRERRHEHDHNHNHERFKKHKKVCTVDTSENITITTPVAVKAYVDSCDVEIQCNGHEIIKESHCRHDVRKFKIKQKIFVHIPIEFVAECDVGEGHVDFDFE